MPGPRWIVVLSSLACAAAGALAGSFQGPVAMPVRPAPGAAVQQNPPDFSWPWVNSKQGYEVVLQGPGASERRASSRLNLLSWPEPLAPGAYRWVVRVPGGPGEVAQAHFTVDGAAEPFLVGSPQSLLRYASRPHPRYVPLQRPGQGAASDVEMLDRLLQQVARPSGAAAGRASGAPDASMQEPGADLPSPSAAKRQAQREGNAAVQTLFRAASAMLLVDSLKLRTAAREHLLAAVQWPVDGSTGVKGIHDVAANTLFAIAWLHDLVFEQLTPPQRLKVREVALARLEDLEAEFFARDRIHRNPFSSHGWNAWAKMAAAAALLAGDDPRADAAFLRLVPGFIASISPWGGEDGGFANGAAYGAWTMGSQVLPFDVLGRVVGVDLFRKPWSRNFSRFMAYFLPPGAASGPFGDAHETDLRNYASSAIQAWARRVDSPLAWWHGAAFGGNPVHLAPILLAPPPPRNDKPAVPNSLMLPSIGWAAMHSDLADPGRVSVYFKSSPFGSYNHGHADQNAFVIHAASQPLLAASGYYDDYGSAHWKHWYQTTQAHNTITFDGGQGQPTQDMGAKGSIVHWSSSPAGDAVTGDASAAYAGRLSKALRSLVYLRPGVVIVHDQLASPQARTWEWNLHSEQRMQASAGGGLRIEQRGGSVCIDMLHSPPVRLQQRTGFPAAPRPGRARAYPDQWHAAFVASQPVTEAEFLVALRVGCGGEVPRAVRTQEGRWRVEVTPADGRRSTTHFTGERASVEQGHTGK